MSELTSEAVEAVLKDCLANGDAAAFVSTPIVHSYALSTSKLEKHRSDVLSWIGQLPAEFLADGGGGWSFLNLCQRRDGEQWTGLHMRMEQLVALAEGLSLAEFLLPREMWDMLPGGVPYVQFREAAK